MRQSCNQYKLEDGSLVNAPDNTAPDNSILWMGYDYAEQCWYFEGKPDTRTLEQLKMALA